MSVHVDISEYFELRFDTSKYESRELYLVPIRPKTYKYLRDKGHVDKKVKGRKKCMMKREIKIQNYKE